MAMKTTKTLAFVAALAVLPLAGCDMDVPDLNNPGLDSLLDNPSPSAIASASTGLIVGSRRGYAQANGYISMLGILGRESYNFDAADPRYVTEMLQAAQLDPGSPAFGGNFWSLPYRNLRSGLILLAAVDKVQGMSDAEKEGVRGFAKTIMALDYLHVINTRDRHGAVIVSSLEIGALDPIVPKDQVLAHIATLLDQARTHLMAGGEAFSFPLSSGFEGMDTPETFVQFNRALKARVEIYRGNHQAALDALAGSFLVDDDEDPQLGLGAYHVYSSTPGDALNGLVDPNLFAHPSIVTDADRNGEVIDQRVSAKITTVPPRTVQGVTSDKQFTLYTSPTAPAPIIRNEELILLRAEANIGLGNLTAAADDINFIRTHSGGLAARDDLNADNILDELLKQRRYSLLFEGGHRWIDMRRTGRLMQLPKDVATHSIHDAFPIPVQETDARG
jgi:hypothetical protein